MDTTRKITFRFNLILYVYFNVCYAILYLFDPKTSKEVPWDRVYEAFPILTIILTLLIPLMLSLFGAKLIKYFWDRFISDIFSIRSIDFQEAWSLVLITMTFI